MLVKLSIVYAKWREKLEKIRQLPDARREGKRPS
jgi:hypothetical protein